MDRARTGRRVELNRLARVSAPTGPSYSHYRKLCAHFRSRAFKHLQLSSASATGSAFGVAPAARYVKSRPTLDFPPGPSPISGGPVFTLPSQCRACERGPALCARARLNSPVVGPDRAALQPARVPAAHATHAGGLPLRYAHPRVTTKWELYVTESAAMSPPLSRLLGDIYTRPLPALGDGVHTLMGFDARLASQAPQ